MDKEDIIIALEEALEHMDEFNWNTAKKRVMALRQELLDTEDLDLDDDRELYNDVGWIATD